MLRLELNIIDMLEADYDDFKDFPFDRVNFCFHMEMKSFKIKGH